MPRRYVPRKNANRWTAEQKLLLEQMRDDGKDWPEIAAACDHPKGSCQATLSQIRRDRRRAAGEEIIVIPRKKFKCYVPPPPEPIAEPTARTWRMSTLVQDAELRARVAILGPNGLLGDPLPGRSALDQRLAAAAASEPPKPPRRSSLEQTRNSLA